MQNKPEAAAPVLLMNFKSNFQIKIQSDSIWKDSTQQCLPSAVTSFPSRVH